MIDHQINNEICDTRSKKSIFTFTLFFKCSFTLETLVPPWFDADFQHESILKKINDWVRHRVFPLFQTKNNKNQLLMKNQAPSVHTSTEFPLAAPAQLYLIGTVAFFMAAKGAH